MQQKNKTTPAAAICEWSPVEWVYSNCPMPRAGQEVVAVEEIVAALNCCIDTATEADTTVLGAALHVAHLFVSMQGLDGRWPEALNLRTGEALGTGRTAAPAGVLRRLDGLLEASEFDDVCARAEAGG